MDCPPVVFLIFNRPELTRQVFEKIREAQPRHLFVVADGPRSGHATDADRCAASRAIIDEVDWPCEVHREFSETNLGCGRRVSSGITSAFERFDEAIILEDDCVPDESFFTFCETLLRRYRDETRVMSVSGNNFQAGNLRGNGGYYFSKYPHIWGWATWRRAWESYDFTIRDWPRWRDSGALQNVCPLPEEATFWTQIFDRCYRGDIDTWDYQFTLSCWMRGCVNAIPNKNIVKNIGFGPDGTHTRSTQIITPESTQLLDFTTSSIIEADTEADRFTFRNWFLPETPQRSIARAAYCKAIEISNRIPVIRQLMEVIRITVKPSYRNQIREKRRLAKFPRNRPSETNLLGVSVRFSDVSLFHSTYERIFHQEIYRFEARTRTPLFIDAGAGIGLAILYLKRRYPESRIIAFEADPELFQILSENVREWGFNDVELHNATLRSEREHLAIDAEEGGEGRIATDNQDVVQVQAVHLADYLREPVEFLKLDVEGAEHSILRSCQEQLNRVSKLFVEYRSIANKDQELAGLVEVLESAGFRIVAQTENAPRQPFEAQPQSAGIEWTLNFYGWRLPESK